MATNEAPFAKDFMTRSVHTVGPDMSLAEVLAFLRRHGLSNAPVVEKSDAGDATLVGFISEGDCLEHLSNELFFGSPAMEQTVRTMMKRHPVCVTPDTDIFALSSVFVSHRYRHLPVVDAGQLVGIVSRRDILHALDDLYKAMLQDRSLKRSPPDLHQLINLRFVAKAK